MAENITKIAAKPSLISKKRVCAYARVSSGKDAMLHSLSAQISYYSKYIQSHTDWIYSGVYADEALSGTKDERPNFQRMLADAKDGKIDIIIVKSVSRFARNTVTLLEATRELKEYGVDVYFEEQKIHTLSSEGELMLSLLAGFAQEEARSVSENMKWRIKKDLSEGIMWGGKSHLGYELIDKKLVLIPEEAKIVKRVFQLFIEGCGIQKIANSFNKEGIQPKYSDHWNKSSVRHILSNVNYTGDLLLQKTYRESYLTKKKRINKGEQDQFLVENDHEAIIDKDTFNLAQQLLAERGVLPKSNYIKGNKSIFTSRIKCGLCGASYRHKTTRYKKIWICHTYDSEGKENCSAKQIPEDNLIKAINQYLGIDSFSEDAFNKKIDYITVFPGNVLRIKRVDGNEDDITWNDPKRSEGWTPEMREKARQRAKAHYKKEGADE